MSSIYISLHYILNFYWLHYLVQDPQKCNLVSNLPKNWAKLTGIASICLIIHEINAEQATAVLSLCLLHHGFTGKCIYPNICYEWVVIKTQQSPQEMRIPISCVITSSSKYWQIVDSHIRFYKWTVHSTFIF